MSDAAASRSRPALGDNSAAAFDVARVRADFPILSQEVFGQPLVYLDSAASAQKPRQVIEAMSHAYETCYANVHRGVHRMSQLTTDAFEAGREKTARFLNAGSADEIVFTRNATEAFNLVAHCFASAKLGHGDEVVISTLEHHANIVPWQLVRERLGIVLRVVPIDDEGNFLLDAYEALLGPRTKLVAITHVSNALGTVVPIKQVIETAHARGIPVLIDGCQAVPHIKVDVQALDADFYIFTGHKLYGPTGVGVLWGRRELLAELPPFLAGGEMIETVDMTGTTYAGPPHRFEAGTPMIAQAVGLGAAIDYVSELGLDNIAAHEHGLLEYALPRLQAIEGLRIIGPASSVDRGATISFVLDGVHPHDVAQLLDERGIAVRAGHHCARPVCVRYGIPATTRASFGLYTTTDEIDALVTGIGKVKDLFT